MAAPPVASRPSVRLYDQVVQLSYAQLKGLGYENTTDPDHVSFLFNSGETCLAEKLYDKALPYYEELEHAALHFEPRTLIYARLLICHAHGSIDGFHATAAGVDFDSVMHYGNLVIKNGTGGLAYNQMGIVHHLRDEGEAALRHLQKAEVYGHVSRPAHIALCAHLMTKHTTDVSAAVILQAFNDAFDQAGMGNNADITEDNLTVCIHEAIYLCWLYYETLPLLEETHFERAHPLRAFQWHRLKDSSDCAVVYLLDYYMRCHMWGAFHTLAVSHLTTYTHTDICKKEEMRQLLLSMFAWFYDKGRPHRVRHCHGQLCTKSSSLEADDSQWAVLGKHLSVFPSTCEEIPHKAFRSCSRCPRVYYCSHECQKTHWASGHKGVCGKMEMILPGDKE